jgi:hypothetical protein
LNYIGQPPTDSTIWSRQSARKRAQHLAGLRSGAFFETFDSYKLAVRDLNHLLGVSPAGKNGWYVSLTDLEHPDRKHFRLHDLLWAIENPAENPFYEFFAPRLAAIIKEFAPTHIGFSLNYLCQAFTTLAMTGFLRAEFPDLKLILGGSLIPSWLSNHPTLPRHFPQFAAIVPEPGEEVLPGLILGENAPPIPAGSRGCAWEAENATPEFADFPLEDYLSPQYIAPFSFTRGCYWNACAFCAEKVEGRRFGMLPTSQAIAQLKHLETATRPRLFHFSDNSLPPVVMKALAENPLQTPWYGFIRFIPEFLDPGFCRALKAAGCAMLQLGLESGNPEVLQRMNKGIGPDSAAQSLKNLKEAGIGTFVYILFGTPFEGPESARQTMEFIAGHHEYVDFLNVAIFSMPSKCEEAAHLVTRPFSPGDLHLFYEFSHPQGWNRTEVRRFLEREFKNHPAIRPIILREPPSFTSNHAPLFLLKNTRRP